MLLVVISALNRTENGSSSVTVAIVINPSPKNPNSSGRSATPGLKASAPIANRGEAVVQWPFPTCKYGEPLSPD